jgi:hypothetical protein
MCHRVKEALRDACILASVLLPGDAAEPPKAPVTADLSAISALGRQVAEQCEGAQGIDTAHFVGDQNYSLQVQVGPYRPKGPVDFEVAAQVYECLGNIIHATPPLSLAKFCPNIRINGQFGGTSMAWNGGSGSEHFWVRFGKDCGSTQ